MRVRQKVALAKQWLAVVASVAMNQPSDNREQIEFWNGPAGERWVRHQSELDQRLAPFGQAVLTALAPALGTRVLDIGCGCGDTSLAAASRVGEAGEVVGLDISVGMLARARERAQQKPHVRFLEGDAATWTTERPFDAALSRFGVMFFADPTRAFENLRRLLVPGGRLAFVCWQALDKNPWAAVPLAATLTVVPPPEKTDPEAPGPFAFAKEAKIRSVLEHAHWRDVEIHPLSIPMHLGDRVEEAVEYALQIGPSARLAADLSEEKLAAVKTALHRALSPYAPRVELPGAAWLVTARAGA